MKKILLTCFLALGLSANAQFSQNFDAGTTTPAGWTVINGGDTNTFIFGPGAPGSAFSQPNAAQINYSTAAHDDYLVTPAITVTAGVNDRLSYFVKNQDPLYVENYAVKLSTTTATAAAFTTIITPSAPAPSTWTQYTIDLTPYVGQTIYIGFHSTSADMFRLLFDDVVSFTPDTGLVAPNCPTLVSPANGATNVASANLTWSAPASGGAVEYYEVYYGTTANPTTKFNAFPGNVTSAALTGLAASTQYYWKVIAKNQSGESVSCDEYSFTTAAPSGCTTSPNGLYGTLNPSTCNGTTAATRTNAYAGEYSTVTVVAGNTYKFETLLKPGYYITIATNDTTPVVLTHGSSPLNYTPTTSGTIRFYSHTDATCTGLTTSATTHTRSVICMGTLAVADTNKENLSVLYPNPFVDVLKISDIKGLKSINISDVSGRNVKTLAPASELNLRDLKSGLYIVSLQYEDGSVKTVKAIKK